MHEQISESRHRSLAAEPNYRVAGGLELTGIFNSYGTAAEAEQSAVEVEPDAIVFLEGCNLSPDHDETVGRYKRNIMYYSEARLLAG